MSGKQANLGFIGLGAMGEHMATNLVRTPGHRVFVSDLNSAQVVILESHGAHACQSVVEVAKAAEIVFLSLPSIVQVEQVADALIASGGKVRTIVDMSTSDVVRTRALSERLRAQGVELIDAPVARSRDAAREGTLLITVGGTQEQYERVKPYLSCMGSDVIHSGDTGCGQVVKIINNMVLLMTVQALAEAITIGRRAGVDGKLLLDTLGMGSADSFALRLPGQKSLAVNEFPLKAFPTDYALKDLSLAMSLAKHGDVDARGAALTQALLERTSEAGFGNEYYPIMVKIIENGYE
ncbi:NAD(P)-dependent oxidoreductase [Paraburkholderia xenovorans]